MSGIHNPLFFPLGKPFEMILDFQGQGTVPDGKRESQSLRLVGEQVSCGFSTLGQMFPEASLDVGRYAGVQGLISGPDYVQMPAGQSRDTQSRYCSVIKGRSRTHLAVNLKHPE